MNHYQPYQHITIHQPEKICETMLVSLFFANFAVVFPVDWVRLIWIYLDPLEICSIKIALDYHHLTIIANDINLWVCLKLNIYIIWRCLKMDIYGDKMHQK